MSIIGPVDRRGFLVGAAALGVAATLPRLGRAATPSKGGHFRIGVADYATQDDLDPANIDTRFQTYLQFQLRNGLVEIGPGGVLVPELAESWEGSKDAKTWIFKLRKGVTFHNGKPLTPADVIYSFRHHQGESSKSTAKPMLASLTDIKADGDSTVVFTLSAGNVGFPALAANYSFMIVPDGATKFEDGMGTGGYILEEWKPGLRSLVKRNPNYWKAGRAHFDSVEMTAIKDGSARVNALVTGQIDAFNFVDPKIVSLLEKNAKVKVIRTASKAHYVFPMLVDMDPFKDVDVRNAMKYAVDRQDMVKRVLHGFGTVGNDQPLGVGYEFYDPSIEQRVYDPEKAKFLLKKAGKSDLAVQLFVSETPFAGATDAAVVFKEHAAKAGINIEVVKTPEDGYWDDVWTKKPLCASRWSGRTNEDAMLSLAYTDEGLKIGWNETRFNNERVNALVVAARSEFDVAKRREMYSECQRIIRDQGGSTVFAFADFVDATSARVQHEDKLSGEWDLDGGRAAERWWFAAS
ncbi:MAG: ABC transporter substrate-binding protein [Dongiaceae bacterium]